MTWAVNEQIPDPPARRAGWSHDWQNRWYHEAGRKPPTAVPCSWQATPGSNQTGARAAAAASARKPPPLKSEGWVRRLGAVQPGPHRPTSPRTPYGGGPGPVARPGEEQLHGCTPSTSPPPPPLEYGAWPSRYQRTAPRLSRSCEPRPAPHRHPRNPKGPVSRRSAAPTLPRSLPSSPCPSLLLPTVIGRTPSRTICATTTSRRPPS